MSRICRDFQEDGGCFVCSRSHGHGGDHMAMGPGGEVYATWPKSSPAPAPAPVSGDIAAEQAQLILRMAESLKVSRELQAELLEEIKRLRHDLNQLREAMVRELARRNA